MPHSIEQAADYERRLDRFAELLSQDVDIPAIRQRMGLTKGAAYRPFDVIRDRLGPQAV